MSNQSKLLWGIALGGTLIFVGLTAKLAASPPPISAEAVRYHARRATRTR